MPRLSEKAKLKKDLAKLICHREYIAFLRNAILDDNSLDDDGSADSSDDEMEMETEMDDIITVHLKENLGFVMSNRYIFRSPKYRDRSSFFDWQDCLSDHSIRFNDDEFLKHFRVSRKNFWHLVSLIRDHEEFASIPGKKRKSSIACHVLVFLYRLGRTGADGSAVSIGTFFGIGTGSVSNFVKRVTIAIKSLKNIIIVWPQGEEKEEMKRRIRVKHGFQNCIGIIDGTLIGLAMKPSVFGESFFCRKHIYAINVQIICDDKGKIRYYYSGWPGSTHDNRAWRNSKVFLNAQSYFENGEYLLGDSAYSVSAIMVPTFKASPGESLGEHKEFFNQKAAGIRVVSEHCNGILKNRFACLKNINIDAGEKEGMKEIMDLFECCCILHNIFLEYDDDVPQEWIDDIDSNHYWTSDDDESVIVNGSIELFNRRDAVFNAFINDFYC